MVLPYINLPENRVPELLNSIGDTLVSAAKTKEEKKRFAAEQLMKQQEQGRQDALANAQMANYQSEADARKHQQDSADLIQHMNATKDIQASLDAGKTDEANLKAKAYRINLARQAPAVSQQPGNTVMPPTAVDLTAPPSPGEKPAEAEMRNADAIAANGPAAPKPTAWNIGGSSYDPEQTKAAEEATREEEATRVGSAYEPIGYGKEAAALVRGNTGKPVEVDTLISQRQRADDAEKARRDMLGQRQDFTASQASKYKLTAEQQIALREKVARIMAQARKDTGGEGSGSPEDLAKLADFVQANPTDQAGALSFAQRLGGFKKPLHTVTTLAKDPEKQAALEVRDAAGNVMGSAPSTRAGAAMSEKVAASSAYHDALMEYRDHLAQNGHILNPYSAEAQERRRLHAVVVARGRKAMELGVSNANIGLEKEAIGGEGIGPSGLLHPMSSPESLDKAAAEADSFANKRIKSLLTPGQPVGAGRTSAPVDNPLTRAAKGKKPFAPVPVDDLLKQAGY